MAEALSRIRYSLVVTLLLSGLVLAPLARRVAASPGGQQQTGSDRGAAEPGGTDGGTHRFIDAPQVFVVCTGWHALCSASFDCRVNGDKASCDCLRVDETHIVSTADIQDSVIKRLTETKCTSKHPCSVDEAPVCRAIKDAQYKVHDVKYEWVSTYSYRGWCSLLKLNLTACDQGATGYAGDRYWAVCDGAPCTENQNPFDPERPLTCQCRVQDTPYVGVNDSCTGDNGGIISSFSLLAWDFENNTYRIPMPGYEYVHGACAPLKSDAAK